MRRVHSSRLDGGCKGIVRACPSDHGGPCDEPGAADPAGFSQLRLPFDRADDPGPDFRTSSAIEVSPDDRRVRSDGDERYARLSEVYRVHATLAPAWRAAVDALGGEGGEA